MKDRCQDCNSELSACGEPGPDGIPTDDCLVCKLRFKIKCMEDTNVIYAKASVRAQTYRELLEDCVSAMRKAQCLIMDKPEAYEIQNKALQALDRANKL